MSKLLILIAVLFLNFETEEKPILSSGLTSKIEETTFKFENTTSELPSYTLYKGTLSGETKISLYINEQEHPCGGNLTILNAMYKYDHSEKWILLNITTDNQKKNYCMVEDDFTGVLFLEKTGDVLNGNWISPNTKKQYKVELEKVILEETKIEQLEEILYDDLLYNKNDC
jgi:hypothetical protein